MIDWSPVRVNILVCAFGGISPMAKALNHKHRTTVQQWLARGNVPHWRLREIAEAAAREGVKLPKWFKNGTAELAAKP